MPEPSPAPAPRRQGDAALRVLLVASIAPVPVVSGRSLVLAHLLDTARAVAGRDAVRLALLGHDSLPAGLDPDEAVAIGAEGLPGAGLAMLLGAVRGRPLALQEARLLGAATLARIEREADRFGATVVLGDSLRLAGLLRLRRDARRVVINADDLLSRRYRRLADWIEANRAAAPNAFGFHAHLLPAPVARALASPRLQSAFFRFEAALLRGAEDALARRADGILMLNAEEAAHLAARMPGARVKAGLPPLPPGPARHWQGAPLLVFLGHLEAPHNRLALDAFLQDAFPAMLRVRTDLRLRLVGQGGEAVVSRMAARLGTAIEATGFTADLSAALAPAAAMIAPLAWGSGVKTKLLDALRHGLPILCTSLAAEGLPLAASGAALIEDDPRRWHALLETLFDRERNEMMGHAARSLAGQLARESGRDISWLLRGVG